MSVLELLDQINSLEIDPTEIEKIKEKIEVLQSKLNTRPYESTIKFLQSIAIANPNGLVVTDEDLY